MEIGYILQKKQPEVYSKLNTPKKKKKKKNKKHKKSNLSENDIKELMSNRTYKRSKGGALRQIK